jgi:hypothetical protein
MYNLSNEKKTPRPEKFNSSAYPHVTVYYDGKTSSENAKIQRSLSIDR